MSRSFLCTLVFVGIMALKQATAGDIEKTDGGGASLASFCNQANHDKDNYEWGSCIAYVTGVTNGFDQAIITLANASGGKALKPEDAKAYKESAELLYHVSCRPIGSTPEQTALVVAKYLADNPQDLHLNSSVLIMSAIAQAWPCSGKE
ncbi:MAG TPA: Rap1a/Tai family immunity protein [Gammaproteobacteria bacterium]